jgi:hypothetical protein
MKTFNLILLGLFLVAGLPNVDCSGQSANSLKPITGGFIQYNSDMIKTANNPEGLTAADWAAELQAMQKIGMDTVIIQFLKLDNESFVPDEKDAYAVDPTEAILSYADKQHMKVIIGLWNKEWKNKLIRKVDQTMLEQNLTNSETVAEMAWRKYGQHQSFFAWYIPQEIWNIDWNDKQNARMRANYRKLSDYCKSLGNNNKPVTFSPYFDPGDENGTYKGDTANPEAIYKLFLKGDSKTSGAGIDILMLQDGVGANCIEEKDIASKVKSYYQQFYNATKFANVEMWGNLESYKRASGCNSKEEANEPTNIKRLTTQIEAASTASSDTRPLFTKLVTFDFFEFMSPVHQGEHFDLRRELYMDYMKWLSQK